MVSSPVNLKIKTNVALPKIFGQTVYGKQCRPRSDAAERGVRSGSILFATHPSVFDTFSGSKMIGQSLI